MFKNFGKVFKFTLARRFDSKTYKTTTILLFLLFLSLPLLLFPLITKATSDEKEDVLEGSNVEYVYVAGDGLVDPATMDFSLLNMLGAEKYSDINYVSIADEESALKAAKDATAEGKKAVAVWIDYEAPMNISEVADAAGSATGVDVSALRAGSVNPGQIYIQIIVPDDSELSTKEVDRLSSFLESNSSVVSMILAKVNITMIMELAKTSSTEMYTAKGHATGTVLSDEIEDNAKAKSDGIMSGLGFAIPYITLMIMYFMVIMYGNQVAIDVVLEKENKLMDTMLVSVAPESMVLGKYLAAATAAIIQVVLWIAALIGGVFGGIELVQFVNKDVYKMIKAIVDVLMGQNLLNPVNIVLAIAVIALSFVLYCSLASVSGALVSKQEDLGSTNWIYAMVILASFLAVLMCGGMNASTTPAVLYYIPFTAVFTVPAGLLLGNLTILNGVIVIFIIALTSILIAVVAGRIYKMTSLYKGKAPKINEVAGMLFGKQK